MSVKSLSNGEASWDGNPGGVGGGAGSRATPFLSPNSEEVPQKPSSPSERKKTGHLAEQLTTEGQHQAVTAGTGRRPPRWPSTCPKRGLPARVAAQPRSPSPATCPQQCTARLPEETAHVPAKRTDP